MVTLDSESITSQKWFIVLITLPACLLYVVAAYLLLDSMTGPGFLTFLFAGFFVFGVLTPILRKTWLDTDIFNYLAVGALEGASIIRLVNALAEGNHRISFLLLGMVLIPLVFLLPRTENANEFSEPFRKQGGLAVVPYAGLFTLVLVILGAVYFVPPVSRLVASMTLLLPGAVGFVTLATLNPSVMDRLGSSGGHWTNSRYSSFSSYSGGLSCGGGGGCGGGGCGGGGCGGCGG